MALLRLPYADGELREVILDTIAVYDDILKERTNVELG